MSSELKGHYWVGTLINGKVKQLCICGEDQDETGEEIIAIYADRFEIMYICEI